MAEKQETVADIVTQIRAAAYIQNADSPQSVLNLADRIEAAHKRELKAARELAKGAAEVDFRSPVPDKDWESICAKCADGDIEPDCEYYGEPNGCNSPMYQHHPKVCGCDAAKLREALRFLVENESKLFEADLSNGELELLHQIVGKARAALAAPPRNCDRFSNWADALRTYLAEHPKMHNQSQRAIDACCNMWLFATAKEEGGVKWN